MGGMENLKELTLTQLKAKLEELENKDFMLKMVDTWTSEDYRHSDELHQQIKAVKNEISEKEMLIYGTLGIQKGDDQCGQK